MSRKQKDPMVPLKHPCIFPEINWKRLFLKITFLILLKDLPMVYKFFDKKIKGTDVAKTSKNKHVLHHNRTERQLQH